MESKWEDIFSSHNMQLSCGTPCYYTLWILKAQERIKTNSWIKKKILRAVKYKTSYEAQEIPKLQMRRCWKNIQVIHYYVCHILFASVVCCWQKQDARLDRPLVWDNMPALMSAFSKQSKAAFQVLHITWKEKMSLRKTIWKKIASFTLVRSISTLCVGSQLSFILSDLTLDQRYLPL